jgi:hypothetical protein
MPDLIPLDPQERSTITLTTYPLNEGEISDMIDIHYNIRDDIGLSPEQVQTKGLSYKGDLMTILSGSVSLTGLHCIVDVTLTNIGGLYSDNLLAHPKNNWALWRRRRVSFIPKCTP